MKSSKPARRTPTIQPRQRAFTLRQLKYKKNRLIGMSQEDAAIAAGYSESYAHHHAFKVDRAVKSGIVAELDRAGLTDQMLAAQLAAMVNLDPRRIYDQDGKLLPVSEWPEDIARAIASIETDELWEPKEEGHGRERVGWTRKVKFWDKGKALELVTRLKKHLNDSPLIDQSVHTNFTVVLEGDGKASNGQADIETEFSVQTADQQ